MIDELHISNLQSHKKTTLKFHKGVNILVGPSDSGKTSILRALRWIFENKPSGDVLRSWAGGETKAEIIMDGSTVSRSKDKENVYKLDKTEFKAFNKGVPEELTTLFNMNEINLQRQLDTHFLLSSTPGEVASHFNHIAHLDEIDNSLTNINGWIRTLEQSIKADINSKKENTEKATQYEYLQKAEIRLEVLEMDHGKMLQDIQTRRKLNLHLIAIREVERYIKGASYHLQFEEQVNEILKLGEERDILKQDHWALENDLAAIWRCNDLIEEYSDAFQYETVVDELIKLHTELDVKTEEQAELSELIKLININTLRITKRKELLEKDEERFHDEIGDVCPLCNTKLS